MQANVLTASRRHRTAPGRVARLLAGTAMAVALAGCHNPSQAAGPATTTPTSPAARPGADPAGLLARLVVAEEGSDDDDNRAEWGDGWTNHPGHCNTRELVLLNQSAGKAHKGRGCAPICPTHDRHGQELPPCWISPYDGRPTHNPGELQIDHRVAIAEVARSPVVGTGPAGEAAVSAAQAWTPDQKHALYEDQQNLVAVTGVVNQAKGDLDPGEWKPGDQAAWCSFATEYATTKIRYALSVDTTERTGLQQMFATCPTAASSPGAPPEPTRPAESPIPAVLGPAARGRAGAPRSAYHRARRRPARRCGLLAAPTVHPATVGAACGAIPTTSTERPTP